MKPSNDREAIGLILEGLAQQGYRVTEVMQDTWMPEDLTPVNSPEEAADAVCEVDEAYVYIDTPDGSEGWIFFVLGNEPEEVASNYTVNLDPALSNIVDPWWDR
jgi:hypothetical protein